MSSVIVGAACQPLVGWLLEQHAGHLIVAGLPSYSQGDYQTALVILPVCFIAAILFTFLLRETHCKSLAERHALAQ